MEVAHNTSEAVSLDARRCLDSEVRSDWVLDKPCGAVQCFGSTILEIQPGVILCCWCMGKNGSCPEPGVWYARYEAGKWSTPALFKSQLEQPHWNPVLFRDDRFGVFLFFRVGATRFTWQTYWMRSEDGRIWSEPEPLVPNDRIGRGPSKNAPIILSSGSWLAPGSTELGGWGCFADRSDDGGHSWSHTNYFRIDHTVIRGRGTTQPAFWESRPGRVHAVMQTTTGWIGRSDSVDGGRSWSSVQLTRLPNPNTPIDALRLPEGKIVVALNHQHDTAEPTMPLSLAVSDNDGASWRTVTAVGTLQEGSCTHPALTRSKEGLVLSCTVGGVRVRCLQIPTGVL